MNGAIDFRRHRVERHEGGGRARGRDASAARCGFAASPRGASTVNSVSGNVGARGRHGGAGGGAVHQRQHHVCAATSAQRPLRAHVALRERPPGRARRHTGFQLEATSFSGSINTDIPITMSGGQSGRRSRALRGHGRRRRRLPRPHDLLGLDRHHQALARDGSVGSPRHTAVGFPTVTASLAPQPGADLRKSRKPQGRAADGAGTLVAQFPSEASGRRMSI